MDHHTSTTSAALRTRAGAKSLRTARRLAAGLVAAAGLLLGGTAGAQQPAQGHAASPTPTPYPNNANTWAMPSAGQARPAAPAAAAAPPVQAAPMGYYTAPARPPQPTAYPSYPGVAPQAQADDGPEADAEAEPEAPFLDVAFGTQAPLSVGGQITLETPGRILLQGELGWMPEAYGSLIGSALENFPAYRDATAAVVNAMLSDAVVGRASLGWRPFESAGLELMGGYSLISLSGEVDAGDIAELVGNEFADRYAGQVRGKIAGLSSRLHNVHVSVGWRFVIAEHMLVRASVGYVQTLASDSTVSFESEPEVQKQAQQFANNDLNALYTDNIKLPVLGLNAGYRF